MNKMKATVEIDPKQINRFNKMKLNKLKEKFATAKPMKKKKMKGFASLERIASAKKDESIKIVEDRKQEAIAKKEKAKNTKPETKVETEKATETESPK